MPAKNFLKIDQKEKSQKALKENEYPDIRERILALLSIVGKWYNGDTVNRR